MPTGPIQLDHIPISFVPAKAGDVIQIGGINCRVIEDGSHTDNRIGIAEFTLPPHSSGPPAHFHVMHDEVFYTSAGTIRFHMPEPDGTEKTIDAHVGDVVTVPIRAPHTFSNPFDETAKFINTFTPAFYINYFKLLQDMAKKEGGLTREANMEAMERYATVVVETKKA